MERLVFMDEKKGTRCGRWPDRQERMILREGGGGSLAAIFSDPWGPVLKGCGRRKMMTILVMKVTQKLRKRFAARFESTNLSFSNSVLTSTIQTTL